MGSANPPHKIDRFSEKFPENPESSETYEKKSFILGKFLV